MEVSLNQESSKQPKFDRSTLSFGNCVSVKMKRKDPYAYHCESRRRLVE